MSNRRRLLFITGTRADFGKLKPLIRAVEDSSDLECGVFVTGMHMLARYGSTAVEVARERYRYMHTFINHVAGEAMEMALANTIAGLSRYVQEFCPDLIVVHGDRVETLAGATVGALRNILVAHIEGGEVSGTVDGLIRHSVSKLAHVHFVANAEARDRLQQLGEVPATIHVIGSPDIDVMLSPNLPDIVEVRRHYQIEFEQYGVLLFHPVTTDRGAIKGQAETLVEAILQGGDEYVVIYPNNDEGCEHIFAAYERLKGHQRIRMFPSLRFEYFLTLLKNARFIIGNSSAGIREAPVYAVPSINVGLRQRDRFKSDSILDVEFSKDEILRSIKHAKGLQGLKPCMQFGAGGSAKGFMDKLRTPDFWATDLHKQFLDVPVRQ